MNETLLFNKHEPHLVEVIDVFLDPLYQCLCGWYRERTSEFYAFTFVGPGVRINAHSGIANVGSHAEKDFRRTGNVTVGECADIYFPLMSSFLSFICPHTLNLAEQKKICQIEFMVLGRLAALWATMPE